MGRSLTWLLVALMKRKRFERKAAPKGSLGGNQTSIKEEKETKLCQGEGTGMKEIAVCIGKGEG